MFITVADIVEENGKTVRQNNLELKHTIPLKTLVEVVLPSCDNHGIRGYISEHTRDCDGSMLYSIYYSSDFDTLDYFREQNPFMLRYMQCTGFDEGCLKIIKEA